MDLSSFVRPLQWVFELASKQWQQRRYGARVEIDLVWDLPVIIRIDDANPTWRAIRVVVTASKSDEFLVARGVIQAQSLADRRWFDAAQLSDFAALPVEVARNRQWQEEISGPALVQRLRGQMSHGSRLFIRVVVCDHHGSKLRSNRLETTLQELAREERR